MTDFLFVSSNTLFLSSHRLVNLVYLGNVLIMHEEVAVIYFLFVLAVFLDLGEHESLVQMFRSSVVQLAD